MPRAKVCIDHVDESNGCKNVGHVFGHSVLIINSAQKIYTSGLDGAKGNAHVPGLAKELQDSKALQHNFADVAAR